MVCICRFMFDILFCFFLCFSLSCFRYQDEIIKIDPYTGTIVKHIDMTKLYPKATRSKSADCLNGIAYNNVTNEFMLTGKVWPRYYTVVLADVNKEEL